MKKIAPFILSLFLLPAIAKSDNSLKSMQLATNLGTVLGSEKYCNLSFNQEAIERYIEKNVAADDMQFPSTLSMMIDGTKFSNESRSNSAKTAHCSQIKRLAKTFNFID